MKIAFHIIRRILAAILAAVALLFTFVSGVNTGCGAPEAAIDVPFWIALAALIAAYALVDPEAWRDRA